MKIMCLHGINDFRFEDKDIPTPIHDQILIKVEACGICGSDIPRVYQLGTRVYPVVIGHEFSGVVTAVGSEKDSSLLGKRAAVFPLIPCRTCESCEVGNYCECENYDYLGSRSDGGFAQYCLIPSKWHLVLSHNANLSMEALSMCEPACVAQHALRRGHVRAGQNIVILGAGPIGIMMGRWAKIFGVNNVILTDIDDDKKAFAESCGFQVFNSRTCNLKEEIAQLTNGRGADVVIEGTGVSAGMNDAIEVARIGGTIVWLGNPHDETTIALKNHSLILRKELSMYGVWNSYYARTPMNEWEFTVQMMDEGKLKVEDLITHKAGLADIKQLFEDIHSHQIKVCKAMYSAALDK